MEEEVSDYQTASAVKQAASEGSDPHRSYHDMRKHAAGVQPLFSCPRAAALPNGLSDMRCTPLPNSCARFELSVRELTPIQPISDESRPYSILGQRFITTFIPLASASAAASSLRMVSCIQITGGRGASVSASCPI